MTRKPASDAADLGARASLSDPLADMLPDELDGRMAARWRLVLGKEAEAVDPSLEMGADGAAAQALAERESLDEALGFIYDPRSSGAKADLSRSAPYVPRWLELVRRSFSGEVVNVLIRDGLERRGLAQLLLEPEILANLEPDPQLVAALLALRDLVPDQARSAVRDLVTQLVAKLDRRIHHKLVSAVRRGIQARPVRRGTYRTMDWGRTVRRNLQHYNVERERLIPRQFYFRGADRSVGEWHVVLLADQSGSMAESVIHAAVAASVLASVRSLRTSLLLFGTEVVDMSADAADPVAVLLGAQIGGGTDIAAAVAAGARLVSDPLRTLIVLVSDLYEGGDEGITVQRLAALNESGCRTACMLAITADGRADFNEPLAGRLAQIGTPCWVASPEELVDRLALLWGSVWPPAGPPASPIGVTSGA